MGITIDGILAMRATLLHEFRTPEGMDRETLARTIMYKARNFDVLYPNPDDMAFHMTAWAERHAYKWDGLWKSINYKYDVFVNIDLEERVIETVAETGRREGLIEEEGDARAESVKDGQTGETVTMTKGATETASAEGSTSTSSNSVTDADSDTSGTTHEDSEQTAGIHLEKMLEAQGTSNTHNNFQGFNSTEHRPASQQIGDGNTSSSGHDFTDSTTVTETDGKNSEHTDSHSTTTDTGKTSTEEQKTRNVDENVTSQTDGTATEASTSEMRTGNVRDSQETREDNKVREMIHTTRGDSSLRPITQVIADERAILEMDVYTVIASDFVYDFCIMIY